jgi:hypothetical protein
MDEVMKGLWVSRISKTTLHTQSDNTVELYVMTIEGELKPSDFYAPTELG